MKKMTALTLGLLLFAAATAGCASGGGTAPPAESSGGTKAAETSAQAQTPAAGEAAKEKYVIGITMKNLQDEFPKNIADAMIAHADTIPDLEIIVQDASADIAKQISQVETFVAQGVDAVILNAHDSQGLNTAVDLCNEKGIPIIECNLPTESKDYQAYVGSNDVDAGVIQGSYVNEFLGGQGKVCIMLGVAGQSATNERREGVAQSLLSEAGIEVLAEQNADWQRDKAMTLAENWLTQYPDLDVILCQNDDMAMGALQAVEARGRQEEVTVVGVDAIPDALIAVKEGRLACTVFQDAKTQGTTAVDVAYKWAKGETTEHDIMVPFVLVTKDNVDEIMSQVGVAD